MSTPSSGHPNFASPSLFSPVTPFTGADAFPEQKEETTKWKERNDRQLRLWGIKGQDRIDAANLCLLSATPVGVETLKNVVLPGFGKFTVADGEKVTPRDLGNNFFCSLDFLGKSRAENVKNNLVELNPENVIGNILEADAATLMNDDPDFLVRQGFQTVIASNLDPITLRKLANFCWEKKINLCVVRSYGLVGLVRLVCPVGHEVTEAKPEAEITDLRLDAPFEKLEKFVKVQDLSKMNPEQVRNTPFPVILIHFMKEFKAKYGKIPTTTAEKEIYRQSIQDYHMSYIVQNDPDKKTMRNFEEAVEKAHLAYQAYTIPENVQAIFDDPILEKISSKSSDFVFLCAALKKFYQQEGQGKYLPLQGSIPDMDADTQRFVKLQSIYRRKARNDIDALKVHLQVLLKEHGLSENKISDAEVVDFCKNALYLRLIYFRSLEDELTKPNKEEIQNKIMEEGNQAPVVFYLALQAADRFYMKHKRYPGDKPGSDSLQSNEEFEQDCQEVKSILDEINKEYEIPDDAYSTEDFAKEITRYGAAELHNISSLIGGVAAQELIKITTKQRIPLNNTWILNGVTSGSQTFTA